jgi:kynurenine formamidase
MRLAMMTVTTLLAVPALADPVLPAGGSASWSNTVSLAHEVNLDAPLFPGDPPTSIELWNTIPNDGYQVENVTLGNHTGTHVDAPCHFVEGARCIDELPAQTFVRPVAVIDVRARIAQSGGSFQVTRADLRQWERRNGRIPYGAIVVLFTGFGEHFYDDSYFDEAPGFHADAVQWLMSPPAQGGRGAAGTGSDTFGPDASSDADYSATYTTLLNGGVCVVNLTSLESLRANGDTIVFTPPKLNGGSAYQSNVVGLTRNSGGCDD